MLILCPSCGATYDVPTSRLRPGRKVRCAQCGTDWVPLDEDEADASADPALPEVEVRFGDEEPAAAPPVTLGVTAMDRLAAQTTARRGGAALRGAWAASLLLLVGGLVAAFVWRAELMLLWPPSTRLYAILGLLH